MRRQPLSSDADQLVCLVGSHPVVLHVVEDRQQHVEVPKGTLHRVFPGERQRHEVGVSPRRQVRIKLHRYRGHIPAQRLEQPTRQFRIAATRNHRNRDGQREFGSDEFRVRLARSRQRGAKQLRQSNREYGRRRIRPIVDILTQRKVVATLAASIPTLHKFDGVDVHNHCHRGLFG